MLGYEGYALVDGAQFLCTAMSVPNASVRIDSNGSWGGGPNSSKFGLNIPRVYDYSLLDGSFDYEVSTDMFAVMKSWLFARTSAKQIYVYPTKGSSQRYDECLFTSMSFSTSAGSVCTGSCSFIATAQDELTVGSDYIGNRTGLIQDGGLIGGIPLPLNPCSSNKTPIPYWKGRIICADLIPSNADLVSWTLTFDQEIQKHFICGGVSATPAPPAFLGVGPLTATLELEILVRTGTITVPYDNPVGLATLSMDTGSIALKNLELQNFDHGLKGQNDFTTHTMTFQIFDMAA